MANILKAKELNQLTKGTVLFRKGERTKFIGMVVKGSIRIKNNEVCRIAKAGEMIAVADVFSNEYLSDYIAEEDAIFYAFPAFDAATLESFFNGNYEYRGIVIDSMEKEMVQYLEEREELLSNATSCYHFLKKHYELAVKEGMREEIPEDFLKEIPEEILDMDSEEQKISYHREAAKVPLDIKKKYFYNSDVMALYQAEDISYLEKEIQKSCQEIIQYIKDIYALYIDSEKNGLFDKEIRLLRELKKNGKFQMEHFMRVDETKERIFKINKFIEKRTGEKLSLDRAKIEETLEAVLNAPMESISEEEDVVEKGECLKFLKNSLGQILNYAAIEEKKQKEIKSVIDEFVNTSDRLSTKDDVRKVKKQITKFFFTVYKRCIFKWFKTEDAPLPVELFLNYGYMDERLLDEDQLVFLSDMVKEKNVDLPVKIYRMPEWLKAIYEGKKETSRDSFERDYRDFLREEKRGGKITDAQEKELLADNKHKVIFEIDNMFTSNNKMVNGKLSTYVPILYNDQFFGDIERLYLTKKQLCDTIIELEQKDFSVFYREVLYTNPEIKIDKDYIMKRVYPDVILAPVYGTTSSMWQEITGKKRDTPARFIFSIFSENEVEKSVVKAFGRFHWEYCRCEQGTAWNNIQIKSLTSEYMDYIQYYRKNHDLSEERREKIRAQIQRARNNTREIFVSDYETWIYSESKAAMKLNKVSRQIMATYCPFSKNIRESLKTNAAFVDAMARQQRNYAEKSHEWELRIRRRENNNLVVPEVFRETYEYYADK